MKKYLPAGLLGLLTVMTAVFIVWAAGLSVVAATSQLKLYSSPASATVTVGNSVTIQIRLSKQTSSKVDYVNADLRFPANLLEVTSISKTGSHFTQNNSPLTSYNNSTGVINVHGSGNLLGTPADVLVATVTLRTRSVGSASISFSTSSQAGNLLGADNVKNYLDSTAGAVISITNPPTTNPKPSTPPPTTPPPSTSTPTTPSVPRETAPSNSSIPDTDSVVPSSAAPSAAATTNTTTSSASKSADTSVLSRVPVWLIAVAGGSLLLIGAVVWLWWRRRRAEPMVALSPDIPNEEYIAPETYVIASEEDMTESGTMDAGLTIDTMPSDNQPSIDAVLATDQVVPVQDVVSNTSQPEFQPIAEVLAPSPQVNTPIVASAQPVAPPDVPVAISPSLQDTQTTSVVAEQPIVENTVVAVGQTDTINDADPPDMFELGEQRLQQEGFAQRLSVPPRQPLA